MNSWKFLTAFIIIISILTSCNKKKEIWYCQMHPTYTSDKPGQCPICNMDLVRKEIKSAPDAKINSGSGHSGHEEKKSPDENKNADQSVLLSAEKQALIGIQTAKTEFRNLTKNISAYSSVAYDPELYTAILEYKEAIKNEEILNADGGTNTLLKSSITRLNQLGLSSSQISEFGNSKRNPDELILGGKNGKAYIYGYLFENDINYVKRGQQVIFRTESFPDLSFPGKIHGVDSILDEKNRTLRFRSYVTDKKGVLKPQMFGTMEILIPLKRVLSIPKSAIMNTGVHKVAYVRRNSDHFSPVMVRTGIETTEFYEVLQGLAEGDEVVIEANFLLDSETKIKLGGSSSEHSH